MVLGWPAWVNELQEQPSELSGHYQISGRRECDLKTIVEY